MARTYEEWIAQPESERTLCDDDLLNEELIEQLIQNNCLSSLKYSSYADSVGIACVGGSFFAYRKGERGGFDGAQVCTQSFEIALKAAKSMLEDMKFEHDYCKQSLERHAKDDKNNR